MTNLRATRLVAAVCAAANIVTMARVRRIVALVFSQVVRIHALQGES
jgi:hypothetical protein